MEDTSPAMKAIRAEYHRQCSLPELHEWNKKRKFGDTGLNLVGFLVNTDAAMNPDQICFVVDLIGDHWSMQPNPPNLMDRIALATYINSCKS